MLIRVNREDKSGLRLSGLWHITVWIRNTYKLCASEAMNLYDECSGSEKYYCSVHATVDQVCYRHCPHNT